MKYSKKRLYWGLQILGWGIPFALNASSKIFVSSLSIWYILIENAALFGMGILTSHLLRFIFKNKIGWEAGWSWSRFFTTGLSVFLLAIMLTIGVEVICNWSFLFIEEQPIARTLSDYTITFFNALIYLFFWLILYLGINNFIRNQQMKVERLRLENVAKESQLNTLKGQINPHFMFNSLNNIRGLMLEDVDKARDMLTQLSEMLRFSLARKNEDYVPLKEELSVVHNYIALAKIQLEHRLQYVESIQTHIDGIMVPPMLLQMMVENAIKHGIAKLKAGGTVQLELSTHQNQLHIIVVNDGRLTQGQSDTQVGLANIKQRLQLLYDSKASFNLEEIGGQVQAVIKIPLE